MAETKKLFRSKQDKVIGGVCGGIAEYFKIDPVWVRLIAVLLIFFDGIGILFYIIAWIIMPENPNQQETKKTKAQEVVNKAVTSIKSHKKVHKKPKKKKHSGGSSILGIIITIIGIGLLMRNLFDWFNIQYIWPSLLIIIGLYYVFRRKNEK